MKKAEQEGKQSSISKERQLDFTELYWKRLQILWKVTAIIY